MSDFEFDLEEAEELEPVESAWYFVSGLLGL